MPPRVLCLGAVNLDLIYKVEDLAGFLNAWGTGLQPGGEEAVSQAQERRLQNLLAQSARPGPRTGGGQAANTAYALARLGIPVALVGRVGADADGDFLKQSLAGVQLDHLVRRGESGRAYILVDPGGERTILVAPNTNDALRMADIPWEAVKRAGFLHLTSFVGAGPLKVQEAIARRLGDTLSLSLDPGELYARRGWKELEGLLDHLDALLVTEREWALLGGDPKVHPPWGPPLVIIKRGGRGARLLTAIRHLNFPAPATQGIVDTLGAGDVFAAGYLAGRLLKLALPAVVRLAVRLATASLSGAGRESYPDREFLEKQLRFLG
jgi:sugar/nucleoside kinase (ribokinase family)